MAAPRDRDHAIGWHRRADDRMVAGVAGGIADRLAVDVNAVRLVFVMLAFANGLGVFLYAVAWALLPTGARTGDVLATRRAADREVDLARGLAVGAIVLGTVLLARRVSPWLPDRLLLPAVVTATGLAMVWRRGPSRGGFISALTSLERRRPEDALRVVTAMWSGSGRRSTVRIVSGALLVAFGVSAFVAANKSFAALRGGLLAGAILSLGIALILGPWLLRLSTDLAAERRARIRSEARSEFATHIHDSVLQTLAIIQRRADQPREVVTLARRQERELRAWLYGGGDVDTDAHRQTLGEALEALTDDVEADHRVRVDLVRVGDRLMDDQLGALVAATREALVNAAKHAGVEDVSVYAEISGRSVSVFVRDRGVGFVPDAVGPDRRGVSDSIRARMDRAGGSARISSTPGEGTEVELTITTNDEPTTIAKVRGSERRTASRGAS